MKPITIPAWGSGAKKLKTKKYNSPFHHILQKTARENLINAQKKKERGRERREKKKYHLSTHSFCKILFCFFFFFWFFFVLRSVENRYSLNSFFNTDPFSFLFLFCLVLHFHSSFLQVLNSRASNYIQNTRCLLQFNC